MTDLTPAARFAKRHPRVDPAPIADTWRETYLMQQVERVERKHAEWVKAYTEKAKELGARYREMVSTVEAWKSQTMRLRAALRESVATSSLLEARLHVVSVELQRLKREARQCKT